LGLALVVSFEIAGGNAAVVPALPALVLGVAVAAILTAPVLTGGKPATEGVALTLLGLLYVSWFLGHALLLRHLADGAGLVLVLVSVTWVGETAAYAVGSWLGRHKLVPAISPGKTVEGALAQLVASIVAAVVFGPGWLLPSWTMGFAAGAGAILGVVGQLGDLAESAIKRSVGVKDAGGLIPGHGGVPDGLVALTRDVPADVVVSALVGGAGLLPTMAAIRAGRAVALANKETLVMAGRLMTTAARHHGVPLLPVDSEHSAVFQCLCGHNR